MARHSMMIQGIVGTRFALGQRLKSSGSASMEHGRPALQGLSVRKYGRLVLQGLSVRKHGKPALQGLSARKYGRPVLQGQNAQKINSRRNPLSIQQLLVLRPIYPYVLRLHRVIHMYLPSTHIARDLQVLPSVTQLNKKS